MLILLLLSLVRDAVGLPTFQCAESSSLTLPTRSTSGIVWSCISTIFICTWVAVHPNVPAIHASDRELFWRRVKILAVALIAPEFIIIWAANQLRSAWYALRKLHEFDACRHWTMTHGMFLVMGGFMLADPTGKHIQVLHRRHLERLLRTGDVSLPHILESEIMDRSKGDALAKTLVLIQTTWFITQVVSRVVLHLPITELELTTVAFALLNFFTYALWWKKPLDVRYPVTVALRPDSFEAILLDDSPSTLHFASPSPFHATSDSVLEAEGGVKASRLSELEGSKERSLVQDVRDSNTGPASTPSLTQNSRLGSDIMNGVHSDYSSVCSVEDSHQELSDRDPQAFPASRTSHSSNRRSKSIVRYSTDYARLEQFLRDIQGDVLSDKNVTEVNPCNKSELEGSPANTAKTWNTIRPPSPSICFPKKFANTMSLAFKSLKNTMRDIQLRAPNLITPSLPTCRPFTLSMWTTFVDLSRGFISPANLLSWENEKYIHSVPIFHAGIRDSFAFSRLYDFGPMILEMLIGTLFGSIHCAAWAFEFPSKLERNLWRTMSLCITIAPMAIIVVASMAWTSHFVHLAKVNRLVLPVYILARLTLLVMAFVLLRDLPEGAFEEVQWTTFIPHV
ncbi:hypothetical protein GYMLUDRAFT_436794 [Collybiopsis luxurians FD-317 M1]|uniref:Uncharacterized protein n=1 Tax=Collybiopsis luxurians FD-317 M1 TaxID=944289 RepID=A0A0D0CMA9_9AGAR|nr:hypothetical protein GYMLUDRAFT_436794 [Collybiopsis luxurians FD-317 M1]